MHVFRRVLCAKLAHELNSSGLLWQSYWGGRKELSTVPRGRVPSWWVKQFGWVDCPTKYYMCVEE